MWGRAHLRYLRYLRYLRLDHLPSLWTAGRCQVAASTFTNDEEIGVRGRQEG